MINTAAPPQSPAVTQALGRGRVASGPTPWLAKTCPEPASPSGRVVCLGALEGDVGRLQSCPSAGLTGLRARRVAPTHSTARRGCGAQRGWEGLPEEGVPGMSAGRESPSLRFGVVVSVSCQGGQWHVSRAECLKWRRQLSSRKCSCSQDPESGVRGRPPDSGPSGSGSHH